MQLRNIQSTRIHLQSTQSAVESHDPPSETLPGARVVLVAFVVVTGVVAGGAGVLVTGFVAFVVVTGEATHSKLTHFPD